MRVDQYFLGEIFHLHPNLLRNIKQKNYIQSTCVDIYIHIMLLLYFVAQKNGKPTGK